MLISVSATCVIYIFKNKLLTLRLPVFCPISDPLTPLIQLHCIHKCLSLVICILWYSGLEIWCTCLLEYFDLIKQVVSFEIRNKCLVKNDVYSCNPFCIFLCFLFFLLSFFDQTMLLVITVIYYCLSPCLLSALGLSCQFV